MASKYIKRKLADVYVKMEFFSIEGKKVVGDRDLTNTVNKLELMDIICFIDFKMHI